MVSLHELLCSYDLYHVLEEDDSQEQPVLTLFGRVSTPFWTALFTWRYPVVGPQGQIETTIDRIFGAGLQVSPVTCLPGVHK